MPYMKSLVSCLNHMVHDGYSEDFQITPMGLASLNKQSYYQPEDVRIVNFFRFEGESNPDDNAILYLIETNDGMKGTLVDGYGIYTDSAISNFLTEVKQIEKKTIKN